MRTSGKAMFVCLNKVTCVRMYNFVQEYWLEEINRLKGTIKMASQQEAQELERKPNPCSARNWAAAPITSWMRAIKT